MRKGSLLETQYRLFFNSSGHRYALYCGFWIVFDSRCGAHRVDKAQCVHLQLLRVHLFALTLHGAKMRLHIEQ